MRVNYNVSAMVANNCLKRNDNALSKSIERLSSGLKINRSKDNSAGLAIAKRMNAQLEGLSVAKDNSNDGVSIIETADGALAEVHSLLQRINELAVKGANGVLTDADREAIQEEAEQLKEGIQQMSESTEFNSQPLLDGSFDLRGYTSDVNVKVNSYSDKITAGEYEIEKLIVDLDADGNIIKANAMNPANYSFPASGGFPAGCEVTEVDGNILTISDKKGFEIQLTIKDDINIDSTGTPAATDPLTVDITGLGDMSIQIGANEGQTLDMKIPKVDLKNIGIEDTDFSTPEGCKDALEKMDRAIEYISSVRSRLGAYQNRLESTVDTLDVSYDSMTAAYSRIMDVDMATEMTKYTNMQVLTQAGTSVLAQANERPSQVLQLLQ